MRLPRMVLTASFRLAVLYSLLFIGSVVILGAVVFWTTEAALRHKMDSRIRADASALEIEFQQGGLDRLLAAIRLRSAAPGALDYLVLDANGETLLGDLPIPGVQSGWANVIPPLPASEGQSDEELESAAARELVSRLGDGSLLVVGDDDLGRIDEALGAIFEAFGWAVAATAVLALIGAALVTSGFLTRVDAITRTAEAIIAGDLRQRVPLRGASDDLDRLSDTLNRMLDRVGDLMDSLRQVSSDIAHDLRTPLARLRQHLERTRMVEAPAADLSGAIDKAIADVDDILETFAALLRIAQIEAGTRRSAFRDLDLAQVAGTVVDAFTPAAEEKGQTLSLDQLGPTMIRGDKDLLSQLLANLVENATRHTPAGTKIQVQVSQDEDGRAQIVVEDNGPGVAASDRDKVLRRFYRLEQSRTSPGHGLGLSLVVAIANLHQGQVDLSDAGPGLRVRIAFPRLG